MQPPCLSGWAGAGGRADRCKRAIVVWRWMSREGRGRPPLVLLVNAAGRATKRAPASRLFAAAALAGLKEFETQHASDRTGGSHQGFKRHAAA